MPPTIYDTESLITVVANLKRPTTALLDRYFGSEVTFDSEFAVIDIEKGGRTIAPLVAPHVPAKRQAQTGFATRVLKPAYVKELSEFRPEGALSRDLGEAIGGSLSPEERINRRLLRELELKIRRVNRRLEVMAAEALRTAKLVLSGEDYPTVTVDFQRAAALSPAALAGANRWTETTSKPLKNLKTWATLVRKESGVNPIDVIMGDDAYSNFADHADVKSRLDLRNLVGASLQIEQTVSEGLSFQGRIDGFNIFTYSGWYIDPLDGVEKSIFPTNWITMTAPGAEGLNGQRMFGAIMDLEAGLRALPFFPKMWEEKNPSSIQLLVQSAPITVPTRPDASLAIQVHD